MRDSINHHCLNSSHNYITISKLATAEIRVRKCGCSHFQTDLMKAKLYERNGISKKLIFYTMYRNNLSIIQIESLLHKIHYWKWQRNQEGQRSITILIYIPNEDCNLKNISITITCVESSDNWSSSSTGNNQRGNGNSCIQTWIVGVLETL